MQTITLQSRTTKQGVTTSMVSAAPLLVFTRTLFLVSLAIAWAMPAHAQRQEAFGPEVFGTAGSDSEEAESREAGAPKPVDQPGRSLVAGVVVQSVEPNQPDRGTGSDTGNSGNGGVAQTPPAGDQRPCFAVDLGGHLGLVRGIAFLSDGKRLVSSGYDKTIRIWDIANAETERRIFGEPCPTPEGGVYAVALAPDERTLAVAGEMCATTPDPPTDPSTDPSCGDIRIFDTVTGDQLRVLPGHEPGVVLALSASPDGRLLASAASYPDPAVTVWSLADGKVVARFAYPDGQHRYNKITFLADSRHVAASSETNDLHVFRIGTSEPVATLPADEKLSTVVASTDGKLIAAGSVSGAIRVWNWPDGSALPNIEGNGDPVSALAFGRGSSAETVAAATAGRPFIVRVLNARTGATITTYEGHDNIISALAYSADGSRVASAGGSGNGIHVWSAFTAKLEQTLGGRTSTPYAVGFIRKTGADDDIIEQIAWGFTDPCPGDSSCPETPGELQFSMRISGPFGGIMSPPEPWPPKWLPEECAERPTRHDEPKIARAVLEAGQNRLSRIVSTDNPSRFPTLVVETDDEPGATIERGKDRGEDHISYSFSPDGKMLASGSRNGTLETFTLHGERARRLIGHTGDIWALAYSSDGRLLATGSSDQTVRLWNVATGEQIVSLVHLPASGDWVMWTPQGYFAASPEGESIVSAIIPRGEGKPPEVVTAKEAAKYFFQPAIVQQAIELASAEAAVTWGREQGLISHFQLESLRSVPVGRIEIIEPQLGPGTTTDKGYIDVTIARTDKGTDGSEYSVYVNGNKVPAESSETRWHDMQAVRFQVPLHNGANTIVIQALTPEKFLLEDTVEVVQQGPGPLDPNILRILAIGIDTYEKYQGCTRNNCNLEFAGRDAKTFAAVVEQRMGPAFREKAKTKVLFSGAGGDLEPTKDNIENALNMFVSAKENDTSVLFMAGHGMNDGTRRYLLLASDTEQAQGEPIPRNVVPLRHLLDPISGVDGRKIVFLDTCRSAPGYGFYQDISSATRQHTRLYLASDRDAIERNDFGGGHGAFTYAIERGLQLGEADYHKKDGRISAIELGSYIQDKVRELTRNRQNPYHWYSYGTSDHELVRLR